MHDVETSTGSGLLRSVVVLPGTIERVVGGPGFEGSFQWPKGQSEKETSDGYCRVTARVYTYGAPQPETAGPLKQEQGKILTFEWDRQTGVMTSLTWVTPSVFGDTSAAPETRCLFENYSGTVTQDGYNFDFAAQVSVPSSQPQEGAPWLRGKVAVESPATAAALAAIYEGEHLASLVAFGDLSGDLSSIPTF